ncbi:molybdopterin-dependent oxidoreductase [Gilliamella sp. B2776]|uniref:DMSO/selenate family reductase complex A subunit n=1 Tax=unclassified Gilliamella TaxID=2685620 RepID=UPI00226A3892|nr:MULTISPECIES: DMSO/selenate family reductase complex A subunit [unclassified Gilliamella]MCX8650920.1 molybdopterin-dependent oxidoreductase [Gilliamella sp. B2779]MCX8654003.1 molybdopterin-dependent oxidoreductase [Gilliamella sp. B2737]MCX8692740.1 molybdopterin-dependent oxidoreductase [Gilliamella sp. B2776]MCX8703886.1 molybdopterin-dependent oxidoreductase [Gilliamella sp. B2781]WDM19859.1 molybdopterin-dependent oxidoreductase [Gilliamella sp. B3022]
MSKSENNKMSRRDFLQKSMAIGSIAALASNMQMPFVYAKSDKNTSDNEIPNPTNQEKIFYSACLVNCGSRCPLKVHVKNDIITKISAEDGVNDPIFGQHQIRPCLRGRAVRWRTYDPDRLKYPMLRVGKRGEGKFKRISWEEAISLLADKLKYTIDKYGNEAIYYQYGTGTTGANIPGRNACKRFLNTIGGFLNYHGDYSSGQITAIKPYLYGNANESLLDQIKHSDLVVMFGQNIAETRMSGGGQVTELFNALSQSKARVIIIDPRHSESVVGYDAEWIPIIPGTDAALVAAIGYTLLEEDRIDDEMLNRYCVGWNADSLPDTAPPFSDFKSYILGLGDDRTPKTPEWAAQKTGIPANQIRKLAIDIVSAKAAWISQGWGPQRWQNGEHTTRAIMILPIITGQFGKLGTNIGTWGGSVTYPVPGLSLVNPVKTSIPFFLWTKAIDDPFSMTATNAYIKGKDKLDVGIKFIWSYASNVIGNQHADLNRTHQILQDESKCEFILVWDTHMTASAKYADLLLPDVSSVESNDLINNSYASGAYHYVIRMQRAIKPLWENRSSYDVLTDLSEKMGVKDKFTQGRSQDEWIEYCYEKLRKQYPNLPSFDETDGIGVIDRKLANSDTQVALQTFRDDPLKNPLNTPSGKIEIYSEALAKIASEWDFDEDDKLYPIPAYLPAIEGSEDRQQKQKYPLQLIGFHIKGHCHSSYSNLPQLREAVASSIWINPFDAEQRQIKHGQLVEVYNDRGRLYISAKVTPRILPGVIAIPQGLWAKTNAEGIDIGGCVNRLTSMRPSVLAKSNPQHTNLVDIKPLSVMSTAS